MPVLEGHSQIDLPQHVDTARGSQSKLHRMAATVGAPPNGENYLLPCKYTGDLLHEEW